MLAYVFVFAHLVALIAAKSASLAEFEELMVGHQVARCASGWVCSETSCYHFTNEKLTFRDAIMKCRQFQAELVEINNAHEYNFLKHQASIGHLPSDFWIGLSDAIEEDRWNWISTWRPITFSQWYPGEPNNLNDEDCVHMCKGFSFKWNDSLCKLKRQFLCEK